MIKTSCSQSAYQLLKQAAESSPGVYLIHHLDENELDSLIDRGLVIRLNHRVRITDAGRKFVAQMDR